jgi:hypothetical protein
LHSVRGRRRWLCTIFEPGCFIVPLAATGLANSLSAGIAPIEHRRHYCDCERYPSSARTRARLFSAARVGPADRLADRGIDLGLAVEPAA